MWRETTVKWRLNNGAMQDRFPEFPSLYAIWQVLSHNAKIKGAYEPSICEEFVSECNPYECFSEDVFGSITLD